MDAFWAKGFEATSMTDLCNCTGLHKGSLYQAFGDKHHLFMEALTHYSNKEFEDTRAVISESNTPLENIRAVVNKICGDAGGENGCMMINSLVELAVLDGGEKGRRSHAVAPFGVRPVQHFARCLWWRWWWQRFRQQQRSVTQSAA